MSEKLVRCPFNPEHIMAQCSLQRHVLRCMVNYPGFVTCPFHALHRFKNKDLLAKHMLICDAKDKAYLFQELDDFEMKASKVDIHIPSNRKFNLEEEEENWDPKH